ncbi:hypothetical protein N309_14192, partial [Tinamus guttatus]
AASTTPSSTGGCRSRGWTRPSSRGWGSPTGPSTSPRQPWASAPVSGRRPRRRMTPCCSSTASTSGGPPSPASAPWISISSEALLTPSLQGGRGFGGVGAARCRFGG